MKLYNINIVYTKAKHVTFLVTATNHNEAVESISKGAYISAHNDKESDWQPVISTAKVCSSNDVPFECAKADAMGVRAIE